LATLPIDEAYFCSDFATDSKHVPFKILDQKGLPIKRRSLLAATAMWLLIAQTATGLTPEYFL
jgi:hypothetical protein